MQEITKVDIAYPFSSKKIQRRWVNTLLVDDNKVVVITSTHLHKEEIKYYFFTEFQNKARINGLSLTLFFRSIIF